jgi:integrase/recombinase XerD
MGVEAERLALTEEIDWFLDHLRVERGASPHTVAAYRNDLLRAAEFFERQGVDGWTKLEAPHLSRYEAALGPPLARSTAQRRMSSLRSLLKFLKRNGEGPAADLPSTGGFKKAARLPKALPIEDLRKLLEAPDLATPKGLRDRALMELIYGAGLRVSEAVELSRDALDLDEGSVRVTGKRGKTRRVPLPAGTCAWVRRYLEHARPLLAKRPSSLVLLSDRGAALRRQVAHAALARYSRLAGLPEEIGPHVLRHTYAVHLLKGGADLRVVQELLGHESVATTQVYTGLDMEEVRRKYRAAHPRC